MRRVLTALAVGFLTLVLLAPAAGAAKSALAKQFAAATAQANAAAARLSRAESALVLAERAVDDVTARAAANRERVNVLANRVRALAVQRYIGGATGMTLASEDPGAIARTDAILRLITLGTTDALESFQVAKADLDRSRSALTASLKDRRSAVAQLQADRRKAVAELDRLSKALAALQARLASERKSRASASRSLRAAGIIVTGDWVCPVQGPHSFSNDWGAPRSGGRTHQGNDILAPRGTPVVANVAGSVSRNESGLGGHGYFLHGRDGNTYYGAHLDGYSSAAGNVAAGTVIGYVGDTGDARGGVTHLHFEIHPGGGAAVNPYPTLVKYC
jgi:murein DD-endopeptidase MepM/ murein hydrolase activator NlpD